MVAWATLFARVRSWLAEPMTARLMSLNELVVGIRRIVTVRAAPALSVPSWQMIGICD